VKVLRSLIHRWRTAERAFDPAEPRILATVWCRHVINGDHVEPFTGVAFLVLAGLCSLHAITLPVGLTVNGLPTDMQIMTRQQTEHTRLRPARPFGLGDHGRVMRHAGPGHEPSGSNTRHLAFASVSTRP
jgi:hypothetical protein